MNYKLDFMYNYLDFDNDRSQVRNRFLTQLNRRTTLQDIGETLDDLVLDTKAKHWEKYNAREHHDAFPKRATQDYTSEDFKWSGRILSLVDP